MKESEEPAAVQHDFYAYRQLVESVFKERNGYEVFAWSVKHE